MEATETRPTIRVRINHRRTEKWGWELTETAVEYTGESVDWNVIDIEMGLAHDHGTAEAVARNHAITAGAES